MTVQPNKPIEISSRDQLIYSIMSLLDEALSSEAPLSTLKLAELIVDLVDNEPSRS